MSTEIEMDKKAIAKLKRRCIETAGEIHDIVEDRLWSDYTLLPEFAEKLQMQIKEYESAKDGAAIQG